jgi:amino acid adenylation domain-containing protein
LTGVLLAGGAYVPLDPSQPPHRLQEMLDDAAVDIVVADSAGEAALSGSGRRFVRVPEPQDGPVAQFHCPAGPDNAAYVLYTSGSTGRPKGVVVTHRSIVSLVSTFGPDTEAGAGSVTLAFSSISFDASVPDLFAPLGNGGAVALVDDLARTDLARLQDFAQAHEPTRAFLPVAMLPLLAPDLLPSLRAVLTGAEAPGPEQVLRWTGPADDPYRTFWNLYGPTEACVHVTEFVTRGEWHTPLPIGRPQANQRVYVVDDQSRPVGVGMPGELLIGGVGVARGYLGQPELTESRFIPDPVSGVPGDRVYRTGDLAMWQPDGQLRFLGRTDRQVKIRGQRVEISEVEATLLAHGATAHCVVDAVTGSQGLELVAFVSPASADKDELRAHCARRLPAAMVPSRFHLLDSFPLNDSGKVDLPALRQLADRPATPARPPKTRFELTVATHWQALLGGRAGLDDDFFACGGHSIAAMRLVVALRADLRRDVAIEDVLLGRTLAGVAERVTTAPAISGADGWRGTPPALSPAQQRLWFLDRYAPDATAYNIAMAERLSGQLDVEALRSALRAVAVKQEVLRWRIPDTEGVPRAEVDPPGDVPLAVVDLTHVPAGTRQTVLTDRLDAAAKVPFDLANGPLWRVQLYRMDADEHVLAITAHHAVFDGWSQNLLYRDLATAYEGARLDPLPAGFADYVAWREDRQRRRADDDLAWWVDHLKDAPLTLDLPSDRPRPAVQSFNGARVHGELDEETSAAIGRLARPLGATSSSVLLATLALVLRRITGRKDLVIGTPAVDRRHADFQDMVGFFIEIIPLRLALSDEDTPVGLVSAGRDELLAALARPELALDRLVGALGIGGTTDRNPVAQVMFNMFNFTAPVLRLAGLRAEPVPVSVPGSPFDLIVYGVERDGRIDVDMVYNTDLFDSDRMAVLLAAYLDVLRQIVAEPQAPLSSITLPDERRLATSAVRQDVPSRPQLVPNGPAQPVTETERKVAKVWCEVLNVPAVTAVESFFDAGGTSIAAVAVQARLKNQLGITLSLVELFRFPTVRALAAHLDGSGDAAGSAVLDRAARRTAARQNRRRVAVGDQAVSDRGGVR